MYKVYMTEVSKAHKNEIAFLRQFLSVEKASRIAKMKLEKPERIVADMLLKYALLDAFGIPVKEQNILYAPTGKPYIAKKDSFFSISHTTGLAVCAVSDAPVGVDAEVIRAFSPNLAEKVCAPAEMWALLSAEDPAAEFCKLWTMKEAYAKFTGEGLNFSSLKDTCDGNFDSQRYKEYYITVCTGK